MERCPGQPLKNYIGGTQLDKREGLHDPVTGTGTNIEAGILGSHLRRVFLSDTVLILSSKGRYHERGRRFQGRGRRRRYLGYYGGRIIQLTWQRIGAATAFILVPILIVGYVAAVLTQGFNPWVDLQILLLLCALMASIATSLMAMDQSKMTERSVELTRKHVFGELYGQAQVDDVAFLFPPKEKYELDGFQDRQVLGDNDWGSKRIRIPQGEEIEVAVMFQLAEPQTLRIITIGVHDEWSPPSETAPSAPEITEFTDGLRADVPPDQDQARFHYINWHRNLKIEYLYERRLGRDYLPFTFKILGEQVGTFDLFVEILTAEAPQSYREKLTVQVGD